MFDLVMCIGLLVAPRKLRWSERSQRSLSSAAVLLLGANVLGHFIGRSQRYRSIARLAGASVGATLLGGQYLLSEEDSSVRGSIAVVGIIILARSLLGRRQTHFTEGDAMERSIVADDA
ncbi:MAG TPA: hypothetical protein VHV31_05125 [Nitrolancea sp.]|nr:hypothetical protein [Nitrolancea sp.]